MRLYPGYHVAMEAVNQLLIGPVGGMGGMFLSDDEPSTTTGPSLVICGVLLGRQPIFGIVGEVCTKHHPIPDGDWPQLQRLKQIAILPHAQQSRTHNRVEVIHRFLNVGAFSGGFRREVFELKSG